MSPAAEIEKIRKELERALERIRKNAEAQELAAKEFAATIEKLFNDVRGGK